MKISIIGAQFGDEGKGKITDYLAASSDLIIRWSGGSNAGHTIKFNNKEYKLRLVPSGVFQDKELLISGNCLIDPTKLKEEIEYLNQNGFNPKLHIDEECILSLPIHKKIDARNDLILNIGTTKSGIGPTVSDFVNRIAIKVKDVLKDRYQDKLKTLLKFHTDYLEEELEENLAALNIIKELKTINFLNKRHVNMLVATTASTAIFEGAQGTMLDINHGTYPYCTSTACVSSAIPYVMGIGHLKIDRNIGVIKAYVTRVGNGSFETEILSGDVKEHLQSIGKEVGTNTGRTRRVGWLDLHDLSKANYINAFTELALTKLDVLSGLETIGVLDVERNWWSLNGWKEDISNCKSFDKLPNAAKELINFISNSLKLPINLISVGPDRTQTIER